MNKMKSKKNNSNSKSAITDKSKAPATSSLVPPSMPILKPYTSEEIIDRGIGLLYRGLFRMSVIAVKLKLLPKVLNPHTTWATIFEKRFKGG